MFFSSENDLKVFSGKRIALDFCVCYFYVSLLGKGWPVVIRLMSSNVFWELLENEGKKLLNLRVAYNILKCYSLGIKY